MVGVRGRRAMVAIVVVARGSVNWEDERRQGAIPVTLFGDIVSVMA